MTIRSNSWHRMLPLAVALCLLLTAGMALAQNTLVVNPYEAVDWDAFEQYKANLHTHTTQQHTALVYLLARRQIELASQVPSTL